MARNRTFLHSVTAVVDFENAGDHHLFQAVSIGISPSFYHSCQCHFRIFWGNAPLDTSTFALLEIRKALLCASARIILGHAIVASVSLTPEINKTMGICSSCLVRRRKPSTDVSNQFNINWDWADAIAENRMPTHECSWTTPTL